MHSAAVRASICSCCGQMHIAVTIFSLQQLAVCIPSWRSQTQRDLRASAAEKRALTEQTRNQMAQAVQAAPPTPQPKPQHQGHRKRKNRRRR